MIDNTKNTFSKNWIPYLIAGLTPVIACAIYMLINHIWIGGYTIFCSGWNDELSYYKHVEAIVQYGLPQGYFGFNESTALVGTFGAWNPTAIIPFVIVGKIFGWSDVTPVVFNLVIWMVALCLYVKILRVDTKQMIGTSLIWIAFACNTRYIFSVTPESYITVMLLIFAACLISYYRDTTALRYLVICDVLLFLLSWVRGYYAALGLVLIAVVLSADNKWKKAITQIIVTIASMLAFLVIKHFFTAKYFTDIVNTNGLLDVKSQVKKIVFGVIESLQYVIEALTRSSMRGSWYLLYYLLGIVVIVVLIKRKDKLSVSLLLSWAAILVGMFTIYNAKEGCRHLMAFVTVGFIIINYLKRNRILIAVSIIACIYCTWLSTDSFYTQLVHKDDYWLNNFRGEQPVLTEKMPISEDPWDNTVIFTLSMVFNDLYGLPAGFGISDCDDSYVMENIDNLKSKYVATRIGEEVDTFMKDCGYELVDSYSNTNIYKVR